MKELKGESSWDIVKNREMCYVNELYDHIGFPALVTLSSDPMLSGKLRYCLYKPLLDEGDDDSFKIGRAVDSDLELDGVGISARHCQV